MIHKQKFALLSKIKILTMTLTNVVSTKRFDDSQFYSLINRKSTILNFYQFLIFYPLKRFSLIRSNHQRYFIKKGVFRNFAKSPGKHLWQSLFFNTVAWLRPATLLKKRLWYRCFPVNFVKFLRTPFLQNTSGWLLLFFFSQTEYQAKKSWALNILKKIDRSSHRRCSIRKGVLRNFAKLTRKHLCRSFFFNTVSGLNEEWLLIFTESFVIAVLFKVRVIRGVFLLALQRQNRDFLEHRELSS